MCFEMPKSKSSIGMAGYSYCIFSESWSVVFITMFMSASKWKNLLLRDVIIFVPDHCRSVLFSFSVVKSIRSSEDIMINPSQWPFKYFNASDWSCFVLITLNSKIMALLSSTFNVIEVRCFCEIKDKLGVFDCLLISVFLGLCICSYLTGIES